MIDTGLHSVGPELAVGRFTAGRVGSRSAESNTIFGNSRPCPSLQHSTGQQGNYIGPEGSTHGQAGPKFQQKKAKGFRSFRPLPCVDVSRSCDKVQSTVSCVPMFTPLLLV